MLDASTENRGWKTRHNNNKKGQVKHIQQQSTFFTLSLSLFFFFSFFLTLHMTIKLIRA